MFEIAREMLVELEAGAPLGVVVVTAVHGSAPRAVGSAMAVAADGRAIGSISGGCVEGEAYELATRVLSDGGLVDVDLGGEGDLYAAGLSCGGSLGVVAFRLSAEDESMVQALRESLDPAERVEVRLPRYPERADQPFHLVRERARRMVIVGAVDFSGALASAAKALGYLVTVVDARPVFATRARFPQADDVVAMWPDRYLGGVDLGPQDAICVLTHEERFDIPTLQIALRSQAAYVGAMGSRRTHQRRVSLLREAGATDAELARLRSPIGLDLGGSSPAETAVAIVAEILRDRTGASGRPLSELRGPIH
ncbi:XdhC family protein [Demequina capsici]|uniref:XdhC/CoxI family protein n=1 Tax=Demequina capsici TaxID=3075620 RepID=A0AA96F4C5_9MICO|nr:XdhC/CoxI family protein [Demequina sp. OYTSA14]WNM23692.1 XdhC/CoxI family protein [Demequina sp. OYTSA14]